jgi:chromosome segregation ATPase
MADDKTLKPKSFRISDETADKFKEISSNIGGNQQETLAKLIEAYEFQSGKAILTDRKADIEQFERYVTALTRMYMGSLEDNQNITDTVRTEFDALLKSKDATIQDLQERVKELKQKQEEATEQAKAAAEMNTHLNSEIQKLKEESVTKISFLEQQLADKELLNRALIASESDLKTRIEEMSDKQSKLDEIGKQLASVTSERDAAKYRISEIQIKHEKELLQVEKEHNELIQKLKEQKQAEIDSYQSKYLELLEKLQELDSKGRD